MKLYNKNKYFENNQNIDISFFNNLNKSKKNRIKLSTSIAYRILANKNRYIYIFIILSSFAISLSSSVYLAFSISKNFSNAFSIAKIINSGYTYINSSELTTMFAHIWISLILCLSCFVVCFLLVLLSVKCIKIVLAFNEKNLIITKID